jgi:hypothetical protein
MIIKETEQVELQKENKEKMQLLKRKILKGLSFLGFFLFCNLLALARNYFSTLWTNLNPIIPRYIVKSYNSILYTTRGTFSDPEKAVQDGIVDCTAIF